MNQHISYLHLLLIVQAMISIAFQRVNYIWFMTNDKTSMSSHVLVKWQKCVQNQKKIKIKYHNTYLRSSYMDGLLLDFSLIIGINLSTIHWFSQAHCHGLCRMSISSISFQCSSKCSLIDVKLLLYKMIYSRPPPQPIKWHKIFGWIFFFSKKMKREEENDTLLTLRMGGHCVCESLFDFAKAFGWIVFKWRLLLQSKCCNAVKLWKAPSSIICNVWLYDRFNVSNFGNDGKLCLIQT